MKFLFLIASFITITAQAQNTDSLRQVNTQRNAKQINIPGTRLFITPPPGFTLSKKFTGLEKDKVTGMMVMEILGGNYDSNQASFSRHEFESKGISVLAEENLLFNGFRARYIMMQGDPFTKVQGLFFGDASFTTLIMAPVSTKDTAAIPQVKEAIFSLWYDKSMKTNPLATAPFTMNDKVSVFKFAKVNSGMYIYSLNGAVKQSYLNEPILTASPSTTDTKLTPNTVGTLMISSLERNGVTEPAVLKKSNELVNGFEAYEVEVSGKINGEACRVYQLVVIRGNKSVFIVGITRAGAEKYIAEFRKLARTLKFK